MLILTALAAIMAMAFVATSSATAETTALCTGDGSGCGVSHVHETTLSGAKAKLLGGFITVECDTLFLGDALSGEGAPLVIHGNLTYTNCGGCSVEETSESTQIEILKTSHETAKVTGEGTVFVDCGGTSLECEYDGENLVGTGKGPLLSSETNGSVTLTNQVVHRVNEGSGFLCPKESKLDITTTPLSATYIGPGGTPPKKLPTTLTTSLKGGGKEGKEITVTEGTKAKDTATLSGENASKAGGMVTYKVYKDKACKELVTEAGKVTVEKGKVPDSEEKELEAGAVYYWQAEYGGDELNESSKSACDEILTVKAKVTLSTKLSGGGKEGEEITVAEGSKVKDTATLSGTNVSSATGTVDYAVYKDKECKELATEAGKGKVEGTKAASSEEKELGAGVYYWQAKYLGDSLHEESTSTCGKEVLTVTPSHKTALCTADEATGACLEEHKLSSIDFKDSAAEFLTNLLNFKCEALVSGSVGAAGKPQEVKVEYKFSSCGSSCVVTEVGGGSKLFFLQEGELSSELAKVTTESLELFVKCGTTIKCTYGPVKLSGDGLGALATEDNGHITFSKSSLGEHEGVTCPSEGTLDALFVASSATYIREDYGKPPTSLCSKDEKSPFCKTENQLKSIDYIDKAVELLTNLINVKCEGLVSGSVGEPGNPLEIKPELTYTGCSGGCFVTSVAGPGKILLEREGKAEEAKATAEGFELFVKCGTTIKCLLSPEKMTGTALGPLTTGDNGHLTFSKASLGKGEGATCPSEAATLDALYVPTSAAYIG